MTSLFANSLRRKAEFLGDTPELRRIQAIPRRIWTEEEATKLALALTAQFRTHNGTMILKPAQAIALHDIALYRGLLGPLRVGSGKTLVTLLAAYVLQARAPVLIIPAGLRTKTLRELQTDYYPHWKIPRNLEIISYEELSRKENADKLERKAPDVVICDESQRIKNKKTAAARRLKRLRAMFPHTVFVFVSGSLTTHSIRDYDHLSKWSLGENSPMPNDEGEMMEWADALDCEVPPFRRIEPGPLLDLANDADRAAGEGDDTKTARLAFRRRMAETPGIVYTSGEGVSASLYIREHPLAVSAKTEEHYKVLRQDYQRPDGKPLEEAMQVWAVARQLALGFCYVWTEEAPEEWLLARKAWAKFVRDTLARARGIDTPAQVTEGVEKGHIEDLGLLAAWRKEEPSFTPATKALWHDDAALKVCEAWAKEYAKEGGIIWCEHTWFAEELSRRIERPYYGREGLDRKGQYIEDGSGVVIASIGSNSTGRNLQKWHRSLITSFPTTSTGAEQLLGREHRDGQKADTVEADVLLGCWEHYDALAGAREEARVERDTVPGSDQAKLLIGDIVWPTLQEMQARRGFRWMRTKDAVAEKKTINLKDI